MDASALNVAAQVAQIMGWPVALFLIWFVSRRNGKKDEEDFKALSFEFRNIGNAYKQQMETHIEALREINETLRLLVASSARSEANLTEILERLRR